MRTCMRGCYNTAPPPAAQELMAVVLECSSASVAETLSPVRGGKYLFTQPPIQLLIQLSV